MLNKINKSSLVEHIKKQLTEDFEILKAAALATYEDATHEESKPENEYDTRGLEASYLAGAQGKRLGEIEELFTMYKFLELKDYKKEDAIGLAAIVELKLLAGTKGSVIKVFLVPKGGGMTVTFDNQRIQVVASISPLGEALMGLSVGDIASAEIGERLVEYDIVDVV